jgi:hypothetical protein
MYSEEEITWMSKIHDKSGLGDLAHLPPAIHPVVCRDQPKTGILGGAQLTHCSSYSSGGSVAYVSTA